MDENGFVPLSELFEALRRKFPDFRETDLDIILRNSEKRRFEVKGDRIRAIYGHSIEVRIEYPEYYPVGPLYHGTVSMFLDSILREGLKPMGRLMVHLTRSIQAAREVALRRGKEEEIVILEINAVRAFRDGLKFWDAGDVILTEYVPPKYLKPLVI